MAFLLVLYRLRTATPFEAIAAEFDIARPTLVAEFAHVIEVMDDSLTPRLLNERRAPYLWIRRGLLGGARYRMDTTFIMLPPHDDDETNAMYFHIKSPTRQGVKVQIVIDQSERIVTKPILAVGSKADITIARDSGVCHLFHNDARVVCDTAYQGLVWSVVPWKKPAGGELTDDQKADNTEIQSHRTYIEMVNHRLKLWTILSRVYRTRLTARSFGPRLCRIVRVVCALYNLRFEA
jgi:hypothetical protein